MDKNFTCKYPFLYLSYYMFCVIFFMVIAFVILCILLAYKNPSEEEFVKFINGILILYAVNNTRKFYFKSTQVFVNIVKIKKSKK